MKVVSPFMGAAWRLQVSYPRKDASFASVPKDLAGQKAPLILINDDKEWRDGWHEKASLLAWAERLSLLFRFVAKESNKIIESLLDNL